MKHNNFTITCGYCGEQHKPWSTDNASAFFTGHECTSPITDDE